MVAATEGGGGNPHRSSRRHSTSVNPSLPGGLVAAVGRLTLQEVPDVAALTAWLEERGVPTSSWGEGTTKGVDKLYKEIQLGEAGLEVFTTNQSTLKVVRSTHVLRGKVCSQKSYERKVFLFNTWQQYGDGRKRTRNGLLSEKLSTDEVPIDHHLHEVCKRAVEQEEMQCLVEAGFMLGSGVEIEFDPSYRSTLTVDREILTDYSLELEESKSFPGLLTMYHLYTVDIICSGLPGVDFNTLEFDPPDKSSKRKLKYVHAWNWLRWPTIQRYLFEGSTLKEMKKRGAFASEEELRSWLEEYGMQTDEWGRDGYKTVASLFSEVEKDQAQLELWGRHDGVPLLMRVVHVLQIKVVTDDDRLENKFLLHTFMQASDGRARTVNRLMSRKLSCSQVPFDEERFTQVAKQSFMDQMTYLADVHFEINPDQLPRPEDLVRSEVEVTRVRYLGKHTDFEESPSFKGMSTMYHLYTMELEVDGLPGTNFSSVDFVRYPKPHLSGWRWATLSETLDTLHNRVQAISRQEDRVRRCLTEQRMQVEKAAQRLSGIKVQMQMEGGGSAFDGSPKSEGRGSIADDIADICDALKMAADNSAEEEKEQTDVFAADALPPAMLSKMAADSITDSRFEDRMTSAATLGPNRRHCVPFLSDDTMTRIKTRTRGSSMCPGPSDSPLKCVSDSPRKCFSASLTCEVGSSPRLSVDVGPTVTATAHLSVARRNHLGLAVGLCAFQVAAGSAQLARAKASVGGTSWVWSTVLAAAGAAALIAWELRASTEDPNGKQP